MNPSVSEGREFRCSALSRALDEPQFGTASTVRSWLLLEQPGPWGADTPMQSRLPRSLARFLRTLSANHRIRVVLIRRPGRSHPAARHCYLARTSPAGSWVEHAVIDHPRQLLDADLPKLALGRRVGLGEPHDGPLFLVCTNGRRDPCCAERGRPLARALEREFGQRAWECSHIGGDRFAGNLVCFPHGMYFGRLDPGNGPRVARGYAEGAIDLDHYRGRAAYDFPVQAAESFVRRRERLTGVDDLGLAGRERLGNGRVEVRFVGPSGVSFSVRVEPADRDPQRLTCHALDSARPRSFDLVASS